MTNQNIENLLKIGQGRADTIIYLIALIMERIVNAKHKKKMWEYFVHQVSIMWRKIIFTLCNQLSSKLHLIDSFLL